MYLPTRIVQLSSLLLQSFNKCLTRPQYFMCLVLEWIQVVTVSIPKTKLIKSSSSTYGAIDMRRTIHALAAVQSWRRGRSSVAEIH